MRHVECHAVRTVEMRRPGGSDGPHRSLVIEEMRDEGSGGWGVWLSENLGMKRRRPRIGCSELEGTLRFVDGAIGRWEMKGEVGHCIFWV